MKKKPGTMGRKGAIQFLPFALGASALILVLWLVGGFDMLGGALDISPPSERAQTNVGTSSTTSPSSDCGGMTPTTSKVIQQDMADSSSILGGFAWSSGGSAYSDVSLSATGFTANSANDEIVIVANGNKSQGSEVYFTSTQKKKLSCQPATTFTVKRYQNGTVTTNFYNQVGVVTDLDATNITMGAGEEKNLKVEIQTGGDYANGPYGGIISVEANSSAFKTAKIVDCGKNDMNVASTPEFLTVSSTANKFTSTQYGPLVGSSTKTCWLQLETNSASADDPVVNGAVIYIYFTPIDYYLSEDGTYKLGYQDDDGNELTIKGFRRSVSVI